eukprot:6179615-Pleurochrysis_carterae.AAC.1
MRSSLVLCLNRTLELIIQVPMTSCAFMQYRGQRRGMEAGDGPASSTTDTVLSEVHLQPQTIEATDGVHKLTRFEFEHTLPPEKSPPSKVTCLQCWFQMNAL